MANIEDVQNICVSAFLNGAGINTFYYELNAPISADIAIVRQVTFNSSQLNDAKVYHIWSDLNSDIIASVCGNPTSGAGGLVAYITNPQTIIKLNSYKKIHNLKFVIMSYPQVTITDGGLTAPYTVMTNTYVNAGLTLSIDFIKFK